MLDFYKVQESIFQDTKTMKNISSWIEFIKVKGLSDLILKRLGDFLKENLSCVHV